MIDTTTLNIKVNKYIDSCNKTNHKPTYKGVGYILGISGMTISNVVKGEYNHIPYGNKEHHNRCIANRDFEVIKGIFDKV